jgi:hypothetical protein
LAQTDPVRVIVVPEHDPGQAARQLGDGRARVGQAPLIGEQPKRRDPAMLTT